jgi:hypothetical protein
MIINILIGLGALIAGLLGFAATRPGAFRIQRSTQINMSPAEIFPILVNFKRWPEWSPWESIDPMMKKTMSGAATGKGAIYEWQGNKKVGKGRMEIVDVVPDRKVTIKLDFFEPFEAHNITHFALDPAGAGTDVTWSMEGTNPYMMKVMGIFMNMDKMVGKDFEKGLASLKRVAEA